MSLVISPVVSISRAAVLRGRQPARVHQVRELPQALDLRAESTLQRGDLRAQALGLLLVGAGCLAREFEDSLARHQNLGRPLFCTRREQLVAAHALGARVEPELLARLTLTHPDEEEPVVLRVGLRELLFDPGQLLRGGAIAGRAQAFQFRVEGLHMPRVPTCELIEEAGRLFARLADVAPRLAETGDLVEERPHLLPGRRPCHAPPLDQDVALFAARGLHLALERHRLTNVCLGCLEELGQPRRRRSRFVRGLRHIGCGCRRRAGRHGGQQQPRRSHRGGDRSGVVCTHVSRSLAVPIPPQERLEGVQ